MRTQPDDTKSNNPYRFYDAGWNARVRGEPFQPTATLSWRDGWQDCHEAGPEAQEVME